MKNRKKLYKPSKLQKFTNVEDMKKNQYYNLIKRFVKNIKVNWIQKKIWNWARLFITKQNFIVKTQKSFKFNWYG